MERIGHRFHYRQAMLMFYDWLVLLFSCTLLLILNPSGTVVLTAKYKLAYVVLFSVVILGIRRLGGAYKQVWRYSCVNSYIRLMLCDCGAELVYLLVAGVLAESVHGFQQITFIRSICLVMLSLLGSIAIRMCYTWAYEQAMKGRLNNPIFRRAVEIIARLKMDKPQEGIANKIKIAIVGAGRVGSMLAEELMRSPSTPYTPVCFVDIDKAKIGRDVMGIPVLSDGEDTQAALNNLLVQEIVIAMHMDVNKRRELYDRYKNMGFKIKAYSFPIGDSEENGKRQIREYGVEELLFRQQVDFLNEETREFYRDKVVLISGGGGSIGSELARQIARMAPRRLILLDIYENNVYDIQQEMRLNYGDRLDLCVEIASVRDRTQLDKVFRIYEPEIVLHAAAHKHVPLMEHNCSEAVKNNVFGTLNMVDMAEKHGVQKFIMISTDKAVNPTNVMGASKRMCEMIVLSRATTGKTSFSCTRFGNVLGSNGSVIPLFKRQIANGGPITLTDRRIIRYFMTIPEASQLVLTSGAMAKSGELYVLDMGRPVKILDLAENMIRLSGLEPYKDIDIVETGLRPGEKLFEELLIKTETLMRTDNDMIFIEKDEPLTRDEVEEKLRLLGKALITEDDDAIRLAMKKVVPTFHSANHVNRDALADGRYELEAGGRGQAAVG